MRRRNILAACVAVIGFAIPLVLPHSTAAEETTPVSSEASQVVETQEPIQQGISFDTQLTLRVAIGETVQELPLREYLIGVLLAEMPASFSDEALKAQALASRTFALRKAEIGKHENADVCANSSCCQAWVSISQYQSNAGEDGQKYVDKVTAAVEETDGLVVTYNNELIDATFFSCSGGTTEAAVAVWGGDIPYLQAVDSPGEEDTPRYTETIEIDAEEFAQKLLAEFPEADLTGDPVNWFGQVRYTVGGGVETIAIGGIEIGGTTLRTLFSLRSTDITIVADQQSITITTYGYGHRVGLSQYGAEAMACNGSDFEEILTHYYQDTEIKRLFRTDTEQP